MNRAAKIASIWLAAATALAPVQRVRPSTWAEQNVVLTPEMSPVQSGPINMDWKPWTRAIHDCLYDRPGKKGVIGKKPAQTGFTRAMLNIALCGCDTNPKPILYLISDWRQAAHFASEHFTPVVESIPRLNASFKRSAKDRQKTMCQMPYIGGRADFAGAGTVSAVTARTYVDVYIDEYDVFMDNFPSNLAGSGWELAKGRQQAVESLAKLMAWSHPRKVGEGIDELWERLSDKSPWVWDCPHCAQTINPKWSMVRFPDVDEFGTVNPDAAELHCPHCNHVITDHERAAAVWSPRLGGTGRFESLLNEVDSERRAYFGPEIHRLSDPSVTVRGLAERFVGCHSDQELMAFMNLACGEAFQLTKEILTVDMVALRVDTRKQITVPGGRFGAAYMTTGVDVQAPKENPTFYTWTSCWAPSGMEYVVDLVRLKGWAALANYIRTFSIDVSVDGRVVNVLSPQVVGIDSGFATGDVLNFCRRRIDSDVGHHKVKLLPVRYRPHVRADRPAQMPAEIKRIDPMRPRLGPIAHWDLHRNTWVDRRMSRFKENGRVTILCPVPAEFTGHMTANVLVPVEDKHGWVDGHQEWEKIKNRSDDYMQAGAYGEVAASLVLKLDQLYERAMVLEAQAERRRSGETKKKKHTRRQGEIDPGAGKGWFN